MFKAFKIFILLLLCCTTSVQAQGLLQPGHQLVYEYNVYETGLPDPWVGQTIETITVENDTFINNHIYSKVVCTKPAPCGYFGKTEFLRAEGDKIFRLSSEQQKEFLIIDFGENVGYTLLYETSEEDIDTGQVVIDSFGMEVMPDGKVLDVQYMRIFNNQSFDDFTEYKVYKDIGFVQYGLLFPDLGSGLCDIFESVQLRCSINNADTIHFTSLDCFELSFPDGIKEIEKNSIQLFPNPTSGLVNIPYGFQFLDIINMHGQSMETIQSDNGLDIGEMAQGLYFIKLRASANKDIYWSRIIKI